MNSARHDTASPPRRQVEYWCSSFGERRVVPFHGRTTTVLEAMRACETDNRSTLFWQEVTDGQWSARSANRVYTVRFED